MAYGDTTRARLLSGNNSTTNVSNDDVTQAVAYGDSICNTVTGKSDWTSADDEYESIQTASEYLASSYIRDRFNDEGDYAEKHYKRAMDILMAIKSSSPTTIIVRSQSYRSFPLNPNATPHRSINGPSSSTDDSDL